MKESGTASFVESTSGSHMNAVLTYFVFSFVFFTPWKSGTVTESTFQLVVYDVNNLKNEIESQCCKVRGIPWWVCSCFYLKTVNSNRTYVGYSPWTEARDVWCSPPPHPPPPSRIWGLSLDSSFLFPVSFFWLVLLLFLYCHFSTNGPFSRLFPEICQTFFIKS